MEYYINPAHVACLEFSPKKVSKDFKYYPEKNFNLFGLKIRLNKAYIDGWRGNYSLEEFSGQELYTFDEKDVIFYENASVYIFLCTRKNYRVCFDTDEDAKNFIKKLKDAIKSGETLFEI